MMDCCQEGNNNFLKDFGGVIFYATLLRIADFVAYTAKHLKWCGRQCLSYGQSLARKRLKKTLQ